jgi:nitrogen-specific signal transduction histidine kinase
VKTLAQFKHALRNPLTTVNGYAQLLDKKLSQTKSREANWVKEILKACKEMEELLK